MVYLICFTLHFLIYCGLIKFFLIKVFFDITKFDPLKVWRHECCVALLNTLCFDFSFIYLHLPFLKLFSNRHKASRWNNKKEHKWIKIHVKIENVNAGLQGGGAVGVAVNDDKTNPRRINSLLTNTFRYRYKMPKSYKTQRDLERILRDVNPWDSDGEDISLQPSSDSETSSGKISFFFCWLWHWGCW